MSNYLSTDCETRARARAWIEKFDAADGRYLSRKKKELAAVVTGSKGTNSAVAGYWRHRPIGTWGNHFIFSSAEECDVGDVFPFSYNYDPESVEWLEFRGGLHIHPRRFQKVESLMITDDGVTRHVRYFWQRVQ